MANHIIEKGGKVSYNRRGSLSVVCCSDTRGRAFKIHRLNGATKPGTLVDEIAKILSCNVTFSLNFKSLLALNAKVLNRVLKANAEVIGGEAENFADRRRDACTISVDIVD
jgi:hypothetical protein